MNRFRTKKRAKDTSDIAGTEANRSDSPSVPTLKSSKTFRLGRKNVQEPEHKPELDLANALPSSDDFRTSLLMSGLSARFSMLREQDDPKSKIGKAADDSVLFPKRQSRLNDFGFHSTGLHDIAEVSSIKTSIRPPFASNRIDSFHSVESSGDDGGSIMSRAKPGEGNNLFGGRQKIYKIPVGGSNGDMKKMGGRALYEDDVSQSAFQKLRDREREERERQEREREQAEREDEADSSFPLRSNSPPLLGYNRNRETSSTTSSGPSLTRSSTAATSVYSQRTPSVNGHSSPSTPAVPNQSNGVDRSMTKGKRLYETGLDQHLHSQQHLAMNRLENLSRQQTFGARTPSPSPFPNGNVYEHTNASGSTTHHITIRSASPPPAEPTFGAFDFGVKAPALLDNSKPLFTVPPLSPPMSDVDDQPGLPIQPNDRGKATALGAFSKPVQPYDEKKYSQRQLQMQQGRETPPLRKHSPPRAFNSRQATSGRARTESNATYSSDRSTSSSSAQREFIPRNRNLTSPVARAEALATDDYHESSGTFFNSQNEDSLSSPNDGVFDSGKSWNHVMSQKSGGRKVLNTQIPLQRPPESQHPAHRPSNQQFQENHNENLNKDEPPTISVSNSQSGIDESQPIQKGSSADSPTLGPVDGLSGLVRQHLRNDSGASSIYGAPSPGLEFHANPPPPTSNPYSTKGNPWEINDWDEHTHGQSNGINHASSDPAMNSNSYGVSTYSTPPKANGNLEKNNEETHNPSWEDEMAQRHKRNGSTETQKEQVDFTNKLASARKRVQDNLKSFAESDSRSASPGPGMDWEKDSASSKSTPMGMLKAKSSRESILAKSRNGQSKAMKMLGIGNATMSNSSSPGKQKYDDSFWKQEEEEMLRGVKSPRNPPPMKAYRQARRDAQRDRERQVLLRHRNGGARSSGDDEEAASEPAPGAASVLAKAQARLRQHTQEKEAESEKKVAPRAPSQESKSSAATTRSGSRPPSRSVRDRSGSDASRGSKGRNGWHRDDLARAMAEGHSSSAQGFFEDSPSTRGPTKSPASAYSPAFAPPGQPRAIRSGSDSNPTHMGYFDNQQHQPVQNSPQMENGTFPRPSPIAPYAENRTPALSHPSPLPSGNNTPTSQGFQSQGRIPAHLKRTVNKSDISEPSLVSKTSHIITIDLPVGASLQNGMHSAPPLPTMDPRRRTTRTQTMFNGFMGRGNETPSTPLLPAGAYFEETSTFSADEAEPQPKARQRIRKISSEGGNLNGRTRQVYGAASPAVPAFSAASTSEINMF
jgi:hypothetical protein